MQNKINYIFTLFLILVSVSSCDSYLELAPENGVIRSEFWLKKEDVHASVIGIYSSLLKYPPGVKLPPGVANNSISELLFYFGELRGGMVTSGAVDDDIQRDIKDFVNTNILSSNDLTNWAPFYRTINYCNSVIDLAPGVRKLDPTFTETQLNNYLSEALAIRAYMYFTLARTYRDVPLKLTASLTDLDDYQLPASSQSLVFEQVLKDLNLAEQYAVESYGSSIAANASNKGRITIHAINAMKADVYLWMDKYDEALEATNKVINSGKFRLVNASSWFTNVFAIGNSTESIFEFQYSEINPNPFYGVFILTPTVKSNATLVEELFGIDFAVAENKDIRGAKASYTPGTDDIYKYVGITDDVSKGVISDTHWFLYRYTDVLLMQAEALIQLNRGDEALKIITDIRTSRKALDKTAPTTIDPSDKAMMTNYLLAERAREFAFEGKRWYDLLRNAKRNNYERLDILTDLALATAPADQKQSVVAKLKDSNTHYLPIHDYEMRTNKLLVQNPFYK